MKPPLLTERLTLRPFQDADLPHLLELDADPEVRRYVDMPVAPTMAEVRRYTARWRALDRTNPPVGFWVAESAGRFVGWFHLRPPRDGTPQQAGDLELGYRLRREAWGRGLATEGSAALVRHGFSLQAPRVTAMALAGNRASRRVMEKVGMVCEREWMYTAQDGAPLPAVLYVVGRPAGG